LRVSNPPYHTVLEKFPDHAKAIGIASIEIANLDIFLGYLFAAILRVPFAAGSAVFLSPNGATARLDMLKAAIDEMIQDGSNGKKMLLSIQKRARKVVTDRDAMIHNSWGTNAAGEVATRDIRAHKPMTPVPLEQLEKSILDIRLLIGDVQAQTAKLERDLASAKER
jgi:hypothetical protein